MEVGGGGRAGGDSAHRERTIYTLDSFSYDI